MSWILRRSYSAWHTRWRMVGRRLSISESWQGVRVRARVRVGVRVRVRVGVRVGVRVRVWVCP